MAKKTVNTRKGKAGKAASGRSVKNTEDAQWKSLAEELRSLVPKLDARALAFLVEQARIHIYNMQVDELNKAAQAADTAAARTKSFTGKTGSAQGSMKAASENFRIEGTESGSSYYLFYRNSNVMFSRSEMARLVKIANGEGTDLEIRERLYNWFDRERKDIFALIPIAGRFDDRLKTLAALIRKSFRLRR